jgi:hypothetical protein
MKIEPFLATAAIVTGLFAIGFLVAPAWIASHFGNEALTPGGMVVGRYFGAALLALAWILWASREGANAAIFQGVLVGLTITNGLDALIALHAMWTGVVHALGWSLVVVHALFGAGFAYFASGKS